MKRQQQTTKQRENVSRPSHWTVTSRFLHLRVRIWPSGTLLGSEWLLQMIISWDICLRREKKERKRSDTLGFENNEWYQIKSEGWGGGFSQTQHNGHISAKPEAKRLTVEPTIQRDQTILFNPITPHVSIVSCQFSRLEAFQNTCFGSGDHYPTLNLYLYFFLSSTEKSKFVFSCKVQALEEFMSWTRWIGLLAFLYYRWRSFYLVTIKCFFFP